MTPYQVKMTKKGYPVITLLKKCVIEEDFGSEELAVQLVHLVDGGRLCVRRDPCDVFQLVQNFLLHQTKYNADLKYKLYY